MSPTRSGSPLVAMPVITRRSASTAFVSRRYQLRCMDVHVHDRGESLVLGFLRYEIAAQALTDDLRQIHPATMGFHGEAVVEMCGQADGHRRPVELPLPAATRRAVDDDLGLAHPRPPKTMI